MERFVNALQRFGIGRLAAIIGISGAAAAVLFGVMMNFGSKPMALLYSNLDMKEAAAITQALDQSGVKYKAVGDGSTIMVERDKVADTRLKLSAKGIPTSGSVGYEIFDQSNALGQTDFQANMNKQRALEGELARTIRSIDGVTFAKVQLVLPKRSLFEDEAAPPTAMVLIGSARQLGADQVRALQNLIAAAVPNLKADQVTIVDQATSKTLAGGQGDGQAGAMAEERRNQTEEAIKRKVKETVEGVVGPGRSRVNVTADLDLARVTVQEEKFDPDGQVARSTENIQETSSEKQGGGANGVSASAKLPGGDTATDSPGAGSESGNTHETTNYEISKTVRTEVQEPGAVKKLSVSVAVDFIQELDAKGKPKAPRPLTAEERTNIENLVKATVGFNAERGDVVTVANVRFMRDGVSADGGVAAKSPLTAFDKNDIMRAAELGVLAIVAALVIFFVVRPLIKSSSGGGFSPMPLLASAAGGGGGGGGGGSIAGSPLGGAASVEQQNVQMALAAPVDDSRIDIARIEGQVKASAVKQVSDFVERHPEESVSILRSWLHEG